MNQPPTLHLDRSTAARLCLEGEDGKPVSIEDAFATGIVITPNDMPAAVTLLSRFIETRDEHAR